MIVDSDVFAIAVEDKSEESLSNRKAVIGLGDGSVRDDVPVNKTDGRRMMTRKTRLTFTIFLLMKFSHGDAKF